MQQLENLLRKYGRLSDPLAPPYFCGNEQSIEQDKLILGSSLLFDIVTKGFTATTRKEFEKLPLEHISEDEQVTLIDIGSGMGDRVTLPFARQRPNTQCILVDVDASQVANEFITMLHYMKSYQEQFPDTNLEASVDGINDFYQRNGLQNVVFVEKTLSWQDMELPIPPTTGKVIVTGWLNPRGLGFLTRRIAQEYEAEQVYISNSGIEHINSHSLEGHIIRQHLRGLSFFEQEKLFKLLKGIKVRRTSQYAPYDYATTGSKAFGHLLHRIPIEIQQQELLTQRYKTEITCFTNAGTYNQPAFGLAAKKED